MRKLTMDPKKPPSEGERNARRGYLRQDDFSARRIYSLLLKRTFLWVRLPDPKAGVLDDLVLGTAEGVFAYQIKSSKIPKNVGVKALLLGKGKEVKRLATSFRMLRKQFPDKKLRLIYLTDDFPTRNDRLVKDENETSTEHFIRDWNAYRCRFEGFQNTKWKPLLDELRQVSALNEVEFADFFSCFELVTSAYVSRLISPSADAEEQIEELRNKISTLIVENDHKNQWSRQELLQALNWPDSYRLRFDHSFPIGNFVQKNEQTEVELETALENFPSGYLGLVGPPGSGKSTLLQRALKGKPDVKVLRYLAFVPGRTQGQGRGEADNFFDDLNVQFWEVLSGSTRLFETSRLGRQRAFENSLLRAGKEFRESGTRFIVVVDGLDHIPREEKPDRSLLSALPLPDVVPDGVVFVLGTQRIDLSDMPSAVRAQVGRIGRQIGVQPLNIGATKRISDQLGLPAKINRRAVHDVGQGHPLVTRYLVKLLLQNPGKADELLTGKFVFDGDLEKVYEAAWRSASSSDVFSSVQKVLLLIAFAQGRIEPELLASATSEEAVESALNYAGHLLRRDSDGWDLFHNSFRIFLRGKSVLRFGKADGSFRVPNVYITLAKLSQQATETSPQKWLTFRYLFLAGEHELALDMSGRRFFVQQYLDGRSPYDIQRDIFDAYRLIESDRDPEKLFDLMLAEDEVSRRAEIIEDVDGLISAYLAVGFLDTAIEQLKHPHPAKEKWLVLDALFKQNRIDQARILFEESCFFGGAFADMNVSTNEQKSALNWSRLAVRFMDRPSLIAALNDYLTEIQYENRHFPQKANSEEITNLLRYCLARASVELTKYSDIDELLEFWAIDKSTRPELQLEHAKNLFDSGNTENGLQILKALIECPEFQKLHSSWHHLAVQMAFRANDHILSKLIAKLLSFDDSFNSLKYDITQLNDSIAEHCESLASVASLFSTLGSSLPKIPTHKERLYEGAQTHLIQIGCLLGASRVRRKIKTGEISRIASETMRFIASAGKTKDDDWYAVHIMPAIAAGIAVTLIKLFNRTKTDCTILANMYDQLISEKTTAFTLWFEFRRKLIVGIFNLDGDYESAIERLNTAYHDIQNNHPQDPQKIVSEKVKFVIAFKEVGNIEMARAILRDIRSETLGAYRSAKKDGDYHLWTDLLELANQDDPDNRKSRSLVAVRLIDGLQKNSGESDKATRIAQQVLIEVSISNATLTWNAVRWALNCGAFSWFGILDSSLLGLIVRNPEKAKVALLVWCNLALPWFYDGWQSTTETGMFLKNLFKTAPYEQIGELERIAVHAIEVNGQLIIRSTLLRIIEDVVKKRGGGKLAKTSRIRWQSENNIEKDEDPENRDYGYVTGFEQIIAEIKHQDQYYSKNEDRNADKISYDLKKSIVRVIGAATWMETEDFIRDHPTILNDWEIAKVSAEKAVDAKKIEHASEILEPFKGKLEFGWSWPNSHNRDRHHQIQHIIGAVGIHDSALHDFVEDIAATNYGVSATLWSTKEIFPLLFETVPWAGLWSRLEDNIRAGRDFQAGSDLPISEGLKDDDEFVVRLVEIALEMGATDLTLQVSNLVRDLLGLGYSAIVEPLLKRLLSSGGEKRMRAMDLLVQSYENSDVRQAFQANLADLAIDPDVGVSASAIFLGSKWGQSLEFPVIELPSVYSLELPLDDRVNEMTLRDDHSQAQLLDDPLGWTGSWLQLIELLKDISGIPVMKIRGRVAFLINLWGGINKFGHNASKQQNAKLSQVKLNLISNRPKSVVEIRALRHVTFELISAGYIKFGQISLILHKLHCNPDRASFPTIHERPPILPWLVVPRYFLFGALDTWLENVSSDIGETNQFFGVVIGESRQWAVKKSQDVAIFEQFICDRLKLPETPNLDEALSNIGCVVRIGNLVALDECNPEQPPPVCRFMPQYLDLEPFQVLIFNPRMAKILNWYNKNQNPYIYYDHKGDWCARTIVWRDGFRQSVENDGCHANGQMVVLSESGCEEYERQFGSIAKVTCAWRRTDPAGKERKQDEWRFATSSH